MAHILSQILRIFSDNECSGKKQNKKTTDEKTSCKMSAISPVNLNEVVVIRVQWFILGLEAESHFLAS